MNRKCSWELYTQSGLTKADVRLKLQVLSRVVKGVRVLCVGVAIQHPLLANKFVRVLDE